MGCPQLHGMDLLGFFLVLTLTLELTLVLTSSFLPYVSVVSFVFLPFYLPLGRWDSDD